MGYVKHVDARGGDADRIVFASSCPGISRVSVTADTLAAINQRCGGPSWHCHFGSSLGATDIFTELTVNGQMPEKESLGGSNGV